MNDLNSVIMEGRLTRDPITGQAENGKKYVFCSIASNRFSKMEEEGKWRQFTTYTDIRAFEPHLPEGIEKLSKGDKVRVAGTLNFLDQKHYISPASLSTVSPEAI